MFGVESSNSGERIYTSKSSDHPEPLPLWGKQRSEMINDNPIHSVGIKRDQNRRDKGQCFGIMSIAMKGLEQG